MQLLEISVSVFSNQLALILSQKITSWRCEWQRNTNLSTLTFQFFSLQKLLPSGKWICAAQASRYKRHLRPIGSWYSDLSPSQFYHPLLFHLSKPGSLPLPSQMPLIHEHLSSSSNQICSLPPTIPSPVASIAPHLRLFLWVYILALFRNALLSEGKDYSLLTCAPSLDLHI